MPEELRRQFPAFNPAEYEVAVHEPRAAVLYPERAVQTHLDLATLKGAELDILFIGGSKLIPEGLSPEKKVKLGVYRYSHEFLRHRRARFQQARCGGHQQAFERSAKCLKRCSRNFILGEGSIPTALSISFHR